MGDTDLSGAVPPLRVVLFDFGGVIAEEGFREGLFAIARGNGLDPSGFYRAAQEAVYDSGFVTGAGSEADFWCMLRRSFALSENDAELTRVILDRFIPRPRMLVAVSALRDRGLVCGLLSDQTEWLDRLDARYHFYELFDRLYISCRLGKGKRDASLFDEVAGDLGVAASEILFLDDDPGNVARACKRGIRARLCTNQAQCLDCLVQELQPGDLVGGLQ